MGTAAWHVLDSKPRKEQQVNVGAIEKRRVRG